MLKLSKTRNSCLLEQEVVNKLNYMHNSGSVTNHFFPFINSHEDMTLELSCRGTILMYPILSARIKIVKLNS